MADARNFTRMQRFWSWLAVWLGKHAGLVTLGGLLLTLLLGYGTTKLQFATGQDSYLNPNDQIAIDNIAYQDLFGGQAMLVMLTADEGTTIDQMMSPANIRELDRIQRELEARPDLVTAVITPVTALQWSENLLTRRPDGQPTTSPTDSAVGQATLAALEREPTEAGRAARQADSLQTLARLDAIPADQRTLDNPAWVDLLLYDNQGDIRRAQQAVFTDRQHAFIVVRLVGNASIDVEGEGSVLVRDVIEGASLEGGSATVTGAPILLKDINDYLTGGMLQLGAIAVVIMAVILLVTFDVRWKLLPLAVILVGVVWAFGLAGYLGIPLSLVTIAGLPILLGIGIDYAIQMHARVEEEVVIDRDPHPIQETARNLGPALLGVVLYSVAAMAALRFALVPMIRAFGLLLAIGIAVVCLASIVLPLAVLGAREYRSPTKGRDYREGPLSRFVVMLGNLPAWLAPAFAVASIAVLLGGVAVEDHIKLQSDPVQWVDQSSQSIRDYRQVENETGSSSELGIFIESDDIFSQDTVEFTWRYANELLATHDELLTASSLVTTIGYATEVPGATPLAPRAEDVRAGYALAPPDIQRSTLNPEANAANLIYRYAPTSLEARAVVLDQIKAQTDPPPGVRATPSGLATVGVGLLQNLRANRVLLTYLAILFVGVLVALRLRSIIRSLLTLVPVLIAVGGTSLAVWAFGLQLSPMTAVGGPLVTAACAEFTSLMLLRFLEERRRGFWPRQAGRVASARTGRAFVVSALTTMTGVGVIATSQLPLLRDFGIVVAVNITVALLAALIVLPPLLVWADQRGWVSRGQIPDDVLRATTPRLAGRPEPEALPDEERDREPSAR
ncbi:efflux RND transporter permease subunit [Rhabdothermincola sediminis]|uniref:efflux RND transporter permease subunit n=1 Tax=Rhabdothermincola sediminis TaxID=2751370 RepID=UPI001AA06408|nr:MMPL family transporter [Rhabdothermincola sediminis]